jgi:hypothetical protein
MRKIIVTFAALLALAVPATAGAVGSPRWVTIPTCTATTSDLTCTGRAAGVQPQSIPEFGPVEAAIFGQVHWLCTDPLFDFIGTGDFRKGFLLPPPVAFHNGQVFTIQFTTASYGFDGIHAIPCPGGYILDPSDPSYYDVTVRVGWGLGGFGFETALEAPIGTVTAG